MIRESLKDCHKTNLDLFHKIESRDEKETALFNIYQLKKYEKALNAQEEQQKRRALRTNNKKGSRH